MKLTIEKMIYGGDGLARLPADASGRGKAVFVPFVLPGETVEASLVEEKAGFARAGHPQVLTPAASRVPPQCPHFTQCGGCSYQHAGYAEQVAFKTQILRESLSRTAKLDWQPEIEAVTGGPWHYRNRTRMRLRAAPFLLGYNRQSSHAILDVQECPISSPGIMRVVQAVRSVAAQQAVPPAIHEIEFFADHNDEKLLLEFNIHPDGSGWEKPVLRFAEALRAQAPQVIGIGWMMESGRGTLQRHIPSRNADVLGVDRLEYRVGDHTMRVSLGSFFQTNRFLVPALAQAAVQGLQGRTAYDLYAGVGLFSLPLEKGFERVIAVESSSSSASDLEHNAAGRVRVKKQTVEEFLERSPGRLGAEDAVIVDPPRSGLGERAAAKIGGMKAGRLVYVSCDPATLSRDLRVLVESGYRVENVSLVDLFPQTYHLETVVKLTR